ncbi:MAG: hypothetical protein JW983_04740 [Elusimicrobia bacterium]|nr:hypothetical protein [Elusimicrobiota bacterium]
MKTKLLDEKTVFNFIRASLSRRKIPPTVRETASYFKISKSTAHLYLKRLSAGTKIKTRRIQNSKRMVARGIILKPQKS